MVAASTCQRNAYGFTSFDDISTKFRAADPRLRTDTIKSAARPSGMVAIPMTFPPFERPLLFVRGPLTTH